MDTIEKMLPLGSVVIINGGYRKYMIMSRALRVNINGENHFFDYGACFYPEGLIGDKVMYFQNSDINQVVFEGYSDENDKLLVENIVKAFKEQNLVHADTKALKNEVEG